MEPQQSEPIDMTWKRVPVSRSTHGNVNHLASFPAVVFPPVSSSPESLHAKHFLFIGSDTQITSDGEEASDGTFTVVSDSSFDDAESSRTHARSTLGTCDHKNNHVDIHAHFQASLQGRISQRAPVDPIQALIDALVPLTSAANAQCQHDGSKCSAEEHFQRTQLNQPALAGSSIKSKRVRKKRKQPDDYITFLANKRALLIAPQKVDHSPIEGRFTVLSVKCSAPNCDFMGANEDLLARHTREHHPENGLYPCLVGHCRASFPFKDALDYHIATHSERSFLCAICHLTLPNYAELDLHHVNTHELGLFECSFVDCPFIGNTRGCVIKHIVDVHKSPSQHICRYCGRLFIGGNFKVRLHERTHSNVRPFVCIYPGCTGYAGTQKIHAIQHVRMVHFLLPASVRVQRERGISDPRDPLDYVQIRKHLLEEEKKSEAIMG